MNARYDAVADRLIDTSPPPAKLGTPPEPLKISDPNVQAAHEAYITALREARGPEPAWSTPLTPGAALPKRPGFA
jgi:hypothetical protein